MQRPRAKGGTGLGLSICCKQVAVLGGTIGALSKPACGSVFWFTTPLLLPPHDSSGTESLESEEEAAAAETVAAQAAAEAAPALTPSQAAGAAAIRRSLETSLETSGAAAAAAASSGAATPGTAAASPAKPASEAATDQDSPLPSGIPTGLGRPQSVESGQWRANSGSRRHSMESDLSSMWPSHKSPRRTSGPHDAAEEQADQEAEGRYHPRHALSWEQPAQPPSFTVAEMLSALPVQAASSGAPAVRRPPPTGRPSTSGAVAHINSTARHQLPPSGAGAGAAAAQREAAARSRQGSANVLAGLRVLLAEDNLINQTVAKRVLTNLGCDCRVASNGREAVIVRWGL